MNLSDNHTHTSASDKQTHSHTHVTQCENVMEAVRGVGHINANRSTTVSMEAIAVTTLLMN